MIKYREIIWECIEKGWTPSRMKGSHLIMTKEQKRSVPIPIHAQEGGLDFQIIRKQMDQPPPSKKVEKLCDIIEPKSKPTTKQIRSKVFQSKIKSIPKLGNPIYWRRVSARRKSVRRERESFQSPNCPTRIRLPHSKYHTN